MKKTYTYEQLEHVTTGVIEAFRGEWLNDLFDRDKIRWSVRVMLHEAGYTHKQPEYGTKLHHDRQIGETEPKTEV